MAKRLIEKVCGCFLVSALLLSVPLINSKIRKWCEKNPTVYEQRVSKPDTIITYVPQTGENLNNIAGKFWDKKSGIDFESLKLEIQKYNRMPNSSIYRGKIYKIPIYTSKSK